MRPAIPAILILTLTLAASAGAAWGQTASCSDPRAICYDNRSTRNPVTYLGPKHTATEPDDCGYADAPPDQIVFVGKCPAWWVKQVLEIKARPYTLADIDRMRAAVRKQVPCGNYCDSSWQWRLTIEGMTQTYIAAGISPEALERKAESKP